MGDIGDHSAAGGAEHRRHQRVRIRSAVRAVQDNHTYNGSIKDISLGGAAVEMDGEFDDQRLVELHIENLAQVNGRIARPLDDGFAFEFDPDDIDEDPFLDDIMRLHNNLQSNEL